MEKSETGNGADESKEKAVVIKGRLFDNMNVVQEYTTETLAREADVSPEVAEKYLEELAEDGRIRKRERGSKTKWVRFG